LSGKVRLDIDVFLYKFKAEGDSASGPLNALATEKLVLLEF